MTVSATIQPRSSPIATATLHFLSGYGAEATVGMAGGSGAPGNPGSHRINVAGWQHWQDKVHSVSQESDASISQPWRAQVLSQPRYLLLPSCQVACCDGMSR